MGINKSMSHFKRVSAVCCTKTLSGGEGVLDDHKGFWVSPLQVDAGLDVKRSAITWKFKKIFPILDFISKKKGITTFNAIHFHSQTQATLQVLEMQTQRAETSKDLEEEVESEGDRKRHHLDEEW